MTLPMESDEFLVEYSWDLQDILQDPLDKEQRENCFLPHRSDLLMKFCIGCTQADSCTSLNLGRVFPSIETFSKNIAAGRIQTPPSPYRA